MEAESYGDHETAQFIEEHFVPYTVNIHDKAGVFGRFGAAWTPTVLILSSKAVERWRLEGYHNHDEFRVWMEMGLARTQFMAKKFADAEKWYDHVCRDHPNSWYHPEAMYWRAVCQYNQTHDAAPLGQVAQDLYREHPESIWAMKTMAWLPADHPANRATLL